MPVTSADRLQGVVSHFPQRDPELVTVVSQSAPARNARAGVAEPRCRWLDMIGNVLVASIAIIECRQDGPLGSRAMPGRSDTD